MDSEACRALREIQLGRLQITDFAPPEVFTSGLYEVYSLTLADLRWHLGECDACASSANEARTQLEAVDRGRFEAINEALDAWQEAIANRFRTAESLSDGLARDIVDITNEYVNHVEGDEDGAFGDFRRRILEETREKVYRAAIEVHAFLGQAIIRWLETLLPPAFPRVFWLGDGGKRVDVRIDCGRSRIQLSSAPDLAGLLAGNDQVARVLLRCLLLREAFGGLGRDLADEGAVTKFLEDCATPDLPGERKRDIAWQRIWEHYSDLADMTAERLTSIAGAARPGDPRIQEEFQAMTAKVEGWSEMLQSLLGGQTAVMASLERLEDAAARLSREYEDAPAAAKEGCLSRVKRALPVLFERLADDTRRFLEAAEWVYSEAPAGLDRSLVIVGFTKAFETELWHALQPFRDGLQQSADDRADKNRWKKKPVTAFSLGELARLLNDNSPVLKPLLDKLGLASSAVLEAIGKVNREVQAKHKGARGEAEATSFRALFLGTPSVLAALCPPSRTD